MNRISLAIALVGAVAAAGCGGSVSGTKGGGDQAGATDTFKLVVQNGQDGNAVLKIRGGKVFTADGKINCGLEADGTALTVCEAIYNKGATVTLQAVANQSVDVNPDPAPDKVEMKPYLFLGWSGACTGEGSCTFTSTADQYVVATFELTRNAHSNYTPAVIHDAALAAFARNETPAALNCGECHGEKLQGAGIAVACASCHPAYQVAKFVNVLATPQPKGNENCATCHATDGAYHQAIYNTYSDAPTLVAAIESVVSTPNADGVTYKSVVTFNLKKDGAAYGDATLSGLAQKRYMGTKYDPATKTFETASAISYGSLKSLGSGRYTVEAAAAKFAPELSNSFIYFYFAEKDTIVPPSGHYALYKNVASVAKAYGTLDFESAANSADCEKCHGAPYQKHGYRAGAVPGIPDMVACKACHHDQRDGTHRDWQCLAEDPAAYAAGTCQAKAEWASYDYDATTMNDTHMSHAMEFAYPQSMANCTTCHTGKLGMILTDAKFTITTCKSCHPVTAKVLDAHRAPPLNPAGDPAAVLPAYHTIDRATGLVGGNACNYCHADNVSGMDPVTHTVTYHPVGDPMATDGIGPTMYGHYVPLFKDVHSGYNAQIYAADGSKLSGKVGVKIDTATFDSATNILTVTFSASGADATAIIKPTVVISLYGFDTKDFIVGGHASQPAPDGKRNLEWAEGASGNSPRLTVSPATATAGNTTWTATADLSLWASRLADGSVKKAEIGILPSIGLDQTNAVNTDPTKGAINLPIAAAGTVKTFDLVGKAILADGAVYGKAIVDAAKCDKCHEALGTTFHSPAYGSAGVVGCRLCHVVGSGGSHLEMQSRSIDSYVHAIHSMQPFDIGDVNFADPVKALGYSHHVESTYPNFTTLNCESCHNPGTYNVPDVKKSLPGILSASDAVTTMTRQIKGVPSVMTGPGSRACGGCHRAELVNEDDFLRLQWFDGHTGAWGYRKTNGTGVLDTKIGEIFP